MKKVRESREEIEQDLERWRNSLERRGMKVSRTKTEYLIANGHEVRFPTVTLGGAKEPKVEEFKYLGSTVQEDGGYTRKIRKRVKAEWNAWRKLSGLLCDKRVLVRVKGKIPHTVVRPSMMYGLETVRTIKTQEAELNVAEMKMLRFALGVTRKDGIKNESFRLTAKVGQISRKVKESRLRWYGHVKRREDAYIGRRVLEIELPAKTKVGRPKRRFMNAYKEGMKEVRVNERDVHDRSNWRRKIRCGDP